jgi:hypothetical protein
MCTASKLFHAIDRLVHMRLGDISWVFHRLLVIATITLLSSCASSRMVDVAEPPAVASPHPDQATIVFMRTSSLGFAVQSAVFDITNDPPDFIGIVSSGKKIAITARPGQHRFMVVSEAADFMDAELAAGKTYYALITPRMGVWKARFSLKPVSAMNPEIQEDLKSTNWVENTPDSRDWARDNMVSIQAKKTEYIGEWLAKPDKPVLHANDGG